MRLRLLASLGFDFMTEIFFSVFLLGAVYFLLVRRTIDYFILAYFCAAVYFLPGFFGVIRYRSGSRWVEEPIIDEVYLIFFAVLLSICFFSIIHDAVWKRQGLPSGYNGSVLPAMMSVNAVVSSIALVLMLVAGGGAVWAPDKTAVMESLGRWHIVFYSSAMVGFVISVFLRRRAYAIYFFSLLLFNMYIGFRSQLAVAVLSAVMVFFLDRPRMDLKRILTLGPIILSFGFLMFFYKAIAYAIKAEDWELVSSLIMNRDTYYLMFADSEPFITQSILNEVVSVGFETPPDHLYGAIYQFLIFAPSLGAEVLSFNDYFQFALFGNLNYGMASNIWAQMWSVGGWGLLIFMIFLFNAMILIANRSASLYGGALAALLSPVFCYWVFYIHRNDIAYMVNLEKRMLLMILISFLAASILRSAGRKF